MLSENCKNEIVKENWKMRENFEKSTIYEDGQKCCDFFAFHVNTLGTALKE